MKVKIPVWLILIFIFFVGFFLRVYQVDVNPPSLAWDEASIGYNAYSIVNTLRDEHGRFLPYDYFAAFGDYKPPVAVYLTALSIKLFGFSIWAIRFPSSFFGSLTILSVFFLVEELRKLYTAKTLSAYFSLLVAFLLAVSPWHTLLSRALFEANIAVFLTISGALFLLKGLKSQKYAFVGVIFMILAVYTFNSARLFVPLLLAAFVLLFWRVIWGKKTTWLFAFIVGFVMLLPLLPHLLSPQGQLRFKEVNIFSDSSIVLTANSRIAEDNHGLLAKILHNRRIGYTFSFLNHYLDHFNTDYLFFKGDINPKFSTRSTGQFFLLEFIFLILGLFFLLKNEPKIGKFVLIWLLLGLIPAATARETPHALRSEVSLPAWQIISAAGIYYCFLLFSRTKKKIFVGIISIIFFLEFTSYLHNYYVHYPLDYSQDWEYSYKIAADEILPYQDDYDQIWVSEKYGRPYIFMLTYQKFDPIKFQRLQKINIDAFGFYHVLSYDRFFFDKLDISNFKGKTLLIGGPEEIPPNANKIKDIYFKNGEKSLEIAEL